MKLKELAEITRARTDESRSDFEISGAAGLEAARSGEVTFLANPRYTNKVTDTNASAIFVKEGTDVGGSLIALYADDPYLAYTRALRAFHPEFKFDAGVHSTAIVDPTATLDETVSIDAYVVIGTNVKVGSGVRIFPNVAIYPGATIGEDSVLHSGVVIRENTEIGKRVTIHNNTVVGSDGFGFAKDEDGHWLKIPQAGRVVIEDDVEIGAGSMIDKASVGETRISAGVKIDNLVQIGHSCQIGNDSLICGQVGLAGSTTIGKNVILAGQVGVGGHLTVGDGAIMMAQAGTFSDIPAGKVVSGGVPAFDHRESLKAMAAYRKLPATQKTVRELEERIAILEKHLNPEK